MSIDAIELLKVIGLLDANGKVSDIDRLADETLREQLNYYIENRKQRLGTEIDKSRSGERTFSGLVSSISAPNRLADLLPYCLAYTRVYADDPLFNCVLPHDEYDRRSSKIVGLSERDELDRNSIKKRLAFFEALAPLIQEGIIIILPISNMHRPKGWRPVSFSEDGFKSAIPEQVYNYVQANAQIRPIERSDLGLIVYDRPIEKPVRGIQISFPDDYYSFGGSIWFLLDMTAQKQGDNEVKIVESLNWEDVPDRRRFDSWVAQSINQTALRRLRQVSAELVLAEHMNAIYMTASAFEAKICGMPAKSSDSSKERVTAVNFLRGNTPDLKRATPESVAAIRRDNPELFERFQRTLLDISAQLSGDETNFDEKAQRLFTKEVEPQIQEIELYWNKLKYSAAGNVLVAGATLGLALLGAPTIALASAMGFSAAMGLGYTLPSVPDYLSKRKTPAFIWSKVTTRPTP